MVLAVPRESWPGERRVAATPETSPSAWPGLRGRRVRAGRGVVLPTRPTRRSASTIGPTPRPCGAADIVLKVQPPAPAKPTSCARARCSSASSGRRRTRSCVERLAARKRHRHRDGRGAAHHARAEDGRAVSSMANIAGYRAVIEAANYLRPLLHRADHRRRQGAAGQGAGHRRRRRRPRRDRRGPRPRRDRARLRHAPGGQEQVESMGAEFLELDFEEDGSGEGGYAKEMSPAFIAGRDGAVRAAGDGRRHHHHDRADPRQAGAEADHARSMVERMKPGSVIVDLAAEQGGNCELTVAAARSSSTHGVTIIGYTDLPSRLAADGEPALRHQPRAPARRHGRREEAITIDLRTTRSCAARSSCTRAS